MNFNMPGEVILERDFQRAKRGLQDAINNSQDMDKLTGYPRALVDANPEIVKDSGLHGLLQTIEASKSDIPVFDVILPTEPHDSLLREISTWFRGQIHSAALIKLSVRSSIGGGVVVRSKNRIFDMSFKPKILAAKDKLPEVMRRV